MYYVIKKTDYLLLCIFITKIIEAIIYIVNKLLERVLSKDLHPIKKGLYYINVGLPIVSLVALVVCSIFININL